MTSWEIRQFSNKIVNDINESPLPLEVKRLCMMDVMNQLTSAAEQDILAEKRKDEQEEKKDDQGV